MKKIILFESLSRYRTIFMGLSILLIMFFHSGLERYIHIPYINILFQGTYSGVDAFFLLSAIGLYFSIRQDSSISSFYKKRFIRIIPLYWIACILNLYLNKELNLQSIFFSFTTIDFWANHVLFNWYIPCIVFLYLLFPFYYKVFVKSPYIITICGILFSAYIGICWLEAPFSDYKLFVFRIPIFLIGILIGKSIYEKQMIATIWKYIVILLGFIFTIVYIIIIKFYLGLHWNGGLFYPFIFIYPGLFLFLSIVFDNGGKIVISLKNALQFLGSVSYELYLTHILLLHLAYYMISNYQINYIIAMITCIFILAIITSYFVQKVNNGFIYPYLKKLFKI